jgi:hypothetical protein
MKALKAFLSVVLLSVTAFLSSAQSTRVDSVSFDVRLQDDGSAFVTEVWSMYAGSEGTEMYQPHYYLRQGDVEMDIAGLAVSDETGRQFVSEGKGWDTNRSRRAKEGRCGLVPVNDGYEICWGLGATGQREYTVTYTLTGLVKAYDDCDGFNYTFLAPGQGVPPRSFSLRIVKAMEPLTDENTGIWGFGSHSDLFFQDGEIRARSTEAFRSSNYLTLVVQFDKGLFEPAVTAGGSFDAVLDKAREKLLAMPDAAYFDAMIKLVEKNALDQPGEIRFNSRDLARLPQDYATRIENAAFKHGGRLALSKSAADIDGGFLLIYEGIEQNCSVAALFETNAEELSDKIQKILF